MNIKGAKEEIKNTVRAYLKKDEDGNYVIPQIRQRPMLLIGPPGIGKTQIMEQIARECKIGLVAYTITHHTRQSAVGLPFIHKEEYGGKTYSVTEYTMSEIIASIYEKMKESGLDEGILFIDEINCVSETLAPTMLQFLQCKTFGNQAVPKGWIIVAAGNPMEYNKSVREFDMVTLDRVRKIEVEADFDVWKEYARKKHINPAILSYIELRPQNFYKVEADVDGMQFVTARGWEDLSNLMDVYKSLNIAVTEDIIYEFLQHKEIAKDVSAYIDLYKKYEDDYGITDILEGNVATEVYERAMNASFDERLSVVNLLLSGLNNLFKMVYSHDFVTNRWYDFLKCYKDMSESSTDCVTLYQKCVGDFKDTLEKEEAAGFYTEEQAKLYHKLLSELVNYTPVSNEPLESFTQAKKGFDLQVDELGKWEDRTGQALEYAFDFMEDAFKNGQEMTVFVTELTMNSEANAFLAENTCERYLKYNEELLVGTKKAEILSMLEKDDIYGNEHIREF